MKKAEKQDEFIILRAQGQSLGTIAQRLNISKSTAAAWNKDHAEAIAAEQEKHAAELQELYRQEKAAHRQQLRETLQRIDNALAEKDLAEVPAEKLLRIKLEYLDRLQAEYPEPAPMFTEYTGAELLQAIAAVLKRIQSGALTPQQCRAELQALDEIRKALEYRADNGLADNLLKSFI